MTQANSNFTNRYSETVHESPRLTFTEAIHRVSRRTTKYVNYLHLYDQVVSSLPENPCIMEIGIANGGSLEAWRLIFNSHARVIGVDLNPRVKRLEEEGYEIHLVDTGRTDSWRYLRSKLEGQVDLLVDDGGHTNVQQIQTLLNGFSLLRPGGWLIVEDVHCSYMNSFGNPSSRSAGHVISQITEDLHRRHSRSDVRPKWPNLSERISYVIQANSWVAFRTWSNPDEIDFSELEAGIDDSLMDVDHRWDSRFQRRKLLKFVPRTLRKTAIRFWIYFSDRREINRLLARSGQNRP